jgi:hypothetical protein
MMALSGAQLVAHAGEELRLALARLRELAALVLDFIEQPHILDRDCCLIGKGSGQFNLPFREWPHLGAGQYQHAERHALAQHGDSEDGPKVSQLLGLCEGVVRVGQDVGDMNDFAFQQGACGDRSALGNDGHIPD